MVLVAEFNQDGIPDLLVLTQANCYGCSNDYLGILLGNGDGTFQNVYGDDFDGDLLTQAIAVGDVNGDGYPDIVVADAQTGQLCVLLNNGSGHFGGSIVYNFPTFSYNGSVQLPVTPVTGIAIGDVNDDGKPDLALTFSEYGDPVLAVQNYANESEFGIMLGNGDGTTAPMPQLLRSRRVSRCIKSVHQWRMADVEVRLYRANVADPVCGEL